MNTGMIVGAPPPNIPRGSNGSNDRPVHGNPCVHIGPLFTVATHVNPFKGKVGSYVIPSGLLYDEGITAYLVQVIAIVLIILVSKDR